MNSIQLIGRLTADIELRQTTSGVSVCKFTLAVDRPRVKDMTDFITCVAWRNTAEFMHRYLKKGSKIALNGVLTMRKWDDNEGNSRISYEVVADSVEFCESKPTSVAEAENDAARERMTAPAPSAYDSDDLPF